ncbi:MAG: hypothetical protein NVS3B16_16860 [Vulcanimicrobiaceae bacterium]
MRVVSQATPMRDVRSLPPLPTAAFLAALLLGAAEPAPSPSPAAALTPDAIYLRAIHAMKAEPQPAYVVYREDVRARNASIACTSEHTSLTLKHGDAHAAYRVWFRVRDGASVTQDLATLQHCRGVLLVPAGDEIASLGGSHAGPVPAATASPDAPAGDVGAGTGPALIGAVRVEAARFYRIASAGRDSFEGHDVYRLVLHAYRDPNAHPLTELLVDSASFLIRRASGEVSGHYVVASGRGAGTIAFDRVGPYWVVRDEDFELAFNALFVHARTTVAVRGSEYMYADALPEVTFPSPRPSPHARRSSGVVQPAAITFAPAANM